MKVKKVILKKFKRFTDLTIDLGENPKKIIALVGENGCGKSSIFDAFEEKNKDVRGGRGNNEYLSKSNYTPGDEERYERSNSISIQTDESQIFSKISIYIRSAYRFTSSLDLQSIQQLPLLDEDNGRPMNSSAIDMRLQENYARFVGNFYNEVYDKDITGKKWCEDNIRNLNKILSEVFDIKISSLGNPVEKRGKLYFEKGTSKNFPFDNLSSGEKEGIDMILDLIVKVNVFKDTIFCIDEPELHLNTAIQRKILIAIANLIPADCQLWIATHSIGFLRGLQNDLKDISQVIDMSGIDFDKEVTLKPIDRTRANWQIIFKTVLEDITGLMAPKTIIYCEGKLLNSLDETIFNTIFSDLHDVMFISATNKSELVTYAGVALTIMNKAFEDVKIIAIVDKDDGKPVVPKGSNVEVRYLKRREFENYLFDYEIVSKAFPDVTKGQYNTLVVDINEDDIKPKINEFKTFCNISNERDLKLRLATAISCDTQIYKELKECIFGIE